MQIELLDEKGAQAAVEALADILKDTVEGGASVGFMLPFSLDEARAYWQGVVQQVARGEVLLFVARVGGRIEGTVQLQPAGKSNQTHRADIAKLQVHRRARGKGLAKVLMAAAEAKARELGRWLLVLDTLAGSPAENLYRHLGYTAAGLVRDYARLPEGPMGDTVYFWKRLV